MKYQYTIILAVLICVIAGKTAFATDDFEARPPVFVPEKSEHSKKSSDSSDEEFLQTQTQIGCKNINLDFSEFHMTAPDLYFTFGIQTESTWFDRRINWAGYMTQIVLDSGSSGIRYQASFSDNGREEFQLFDSRVDIYSYWSPDDSTFGEFQYIRFGGGLSYFDCDPYQGQEFLDTQNWAAFFNAYVVFFEFKFVALLNDESWNGGLMELKIFNPFLYFGSHNPDTVSDDFWVIGLFNIIMPFEIGLTNAFGLPEGGDAWGWFIKGRYAFLVPQYQQKDKHLSTGIEIYWSYKSGIGNTRVSESWEFGIKYTVVAF